MHRFVCRVLSFDAASGGVIVTVIEVNKKKTNQWTPARIKLVTRDLRLLHSNTEVVDPRDRRHFHRQMTMSDMLKKKIDGPHEKI